MRDFTILYCYNANFLDCAGSKEQKGSHTWAVKTLFYRASRRKTKLSAISFIYLYPRPNGLSQQWSSYMNAASLESMKTADPLSLNCCAAPVKLCRVYVYECRGYVVCLPWIIEPGRVYTLQWWLRFRPKIFVQEVSPYERDPCLRTQHMAGTERLPTWLRNTWRPILPRTPHHKLATGNVFSTEYVIHCKF